MALCLLAWALPGEWDEWDVDDPLVEERVADEIKLRWSAYNLDETAERILIAPTVAALRQARLAGTLLWAIRSQGDGTERNPLSTLSLSIALVDLVPDTIFGATESNGKGMSTAKEAFQKRVKAIPLDRSMKGFVVEQRSRVYEFEEEISRYCAELFVVPQSLPVTAVISVSTLDPAREEEAREAAGFVARSIHFIPVEEES